MKTINEILKDYTTGETDLEAANAARPGPGTTWSLGRTS